MVSTPSDIRHLRQPLQQEPGFRHGHRPSSAAGGRLGPDERDQLRRTIKDGLERCPWFLVVLSPEAVASEWVEAKVDWAMEHRRGRIIPLIHRECRADDLHLFLRKLQHIRFTENTAADRARVAAELRRVLGSSTPAVPPETAAWFRPPVQPFRSPRLHGPRPVDHHQSPRHGNDLVSAWEIPHGQSGIRRRAALPMKLDTR